jgi:VIT1/CCC1 family predicted Fe2+/Mn2+ transporter
MTHASHLVDVLLAQMPADHPERPALQARAIEYSQDCGCSMGGYFLAGAAAFAIIYFAIFGGFSFRTAVASAVLVLLAAVAGKLTGLLIARLRLTLLRRSIARRIQHHKESDHVNVH